MRGGGEGMGVTQIMGNDIGAARVLQIQPDNEDEVLIHLLASDNSGGFIHLTKEGARSAIAALKAAVQKK